MTNKDDERIVDHIIQVLEYYKRGRNAVTKAFIDQDIAWLKKQRINTEGDFARGYDCGYECCLNSHGAEWFEKQKEQKQEWSEYDEDILNWCISDIERVKHCASQTKPELCDMEINWLKSLRPQSK